MTSRRGPDRGISEGDVRNRHIPVLLSQVISRLAPRDGERFIDATFGAGGYARAILEAADCELTALDRDPSAIGDGRALSDEFAPRLKLEQAPFSKLLAWSEHAETADKWVDRFDGVVFDLGVSSMQLDEADRGFSFQADGPLDMRMFAAGGVVADDDAGPSAADVVNTFSEAGLADIIFQFGEEKRSRRIAKAIVARRTKEPFARTLDLAETISTAVGGRRGDARHPATRTFQALRIFVNDEIGELLRGLAGAERCLKPGGRLVVVTFHSLEDRIVKRFVSSRSGAGQSVSRHQPTPASPDQRASFQIVNHRPLASSIGEAELNPRSRSARLRSAERTAAAAWPLLVADLGVPALARTGLAE